MVYVKMVNFAKIQMRQEWGTKKVNAFFQNNSAGKKNVLIKR